MAAARAKEQTASAKPPPRQRPDEVPIGETSAPWRTPDGALWRVWFSWVFPECGRQAIAAQVAVESLETPRRRVGARVLGQLPLRALEEEARRDLRELLTNIVIGNLPAKKAVQRVAREHLDRLGAPPAPPRRRLQGGRATSTGITGGGALRGRLTREHYQAVARIYREAEGAGRHPTKAVAEWAEVPRSTAATWVRRARDLGELGAAPAHGRAGEDTTKEQS